MRNLTRAPIDWRSRVFWRLACLGTEVELEEIRDCAQLQGASDHELRQALHSLMRDQLVECRVSLEYRRCEGGTIRRVLISRYAPRRKGGA